MSDVVLDERVEMKMVLDVEPDCQVIGHEHPADVIAALYCLGCKRSVPLTICWEHWDDLQARPIIFHRPCKTRNPRENSRIVEILRPR